MSDLAQMRDIGTEALQHRPDCHLRSGTIRMTVGALLEARLVCARFRAIYGFFDEIDCMSGVAAFAGDRAGVRSAGSFHESVDKNMGPRLDSGHQYGGRLW